MDHRVPRWRGPNYGANKKCYGSRFPMMASSAGATMCPESPSEGEAQENLLSKRDIRPGETHDRFSNVSRGLSALPRKGGGLMEGKRSSVAIRRSAAGSRQSGFLQDACLGTFQPSKRLWRATDYRSAGQYTSHAGETDL